VVGFAQIDGLRVHLQHALLLLFQEVRLLSNMKHEGRGDGPTSK
jgi:hypothetical protein